MNTPRILIHGKALDLIKTRRLVLQHAGFDVSVAMNLREVEESFARSSFDLVILCHSLSAPDCESALVQLHSLHPAVKSLVLCKPLSDRIRSDHDAYLTAFASPETLIARARELTVDVGLNPEKGKVEHVQGKC